MRICRPINDQEEFYSGQKHFHWIKYQTFTTLDGIMVHVGGPFSGRRHDARMANDSRIRCYLSEHACSPTGAQMIVCGDEGCGQSDKIKAPLRRNILTPEQVLRNESMRRPRLCAE